MEAVKRILLALLIVISFSPQAAPIQCENFLVRHLLKDANPKQKTSGLKALYHYTVRKPSWRITEKIFGRRKEPSLWVNVPAALIASTLLFNQVDSIYLHALQERNQSEVIKHADLYDKFIRLDFRFQSINADLKAGLITHDEALQRAAMVSLAFKNYYSYRASHMLDAPSVADEMAYINHYLFAHLKGVIENGVNGKKLSDTQVLRLFSVNHRLYLLYAVIEEMLNESEAFSQMQNTRGTAPLVRSITSDPYVVKLFDLYRLNKISKERLRYHLQEDAFWRARLEELETIGITPRASLENIRGEILEHLTH